LFVYTGSIVDQHFGGKRVAVSFIGGGKRVAVSFIGGGKRVAVSFIGGGKRVSVSCIGGGKHVAVGLLLGESGVLGENHRLATSHWQIYHIILYRVHFA
jgi:hypothetical protein